MQKELNATSGSQFAVLPLVKPVIWFARAVIPVWKQNQEKKYENWKNDHQGRNALIFFQILSTYS